MSKQVFQKDLYLDFMYEASQKDKYLELMHEAIVEKGQPEDQFEKFKSWLEGTDFFTAPASTRFHGAFEGGLLKHHLDVYQYASELLSLNKFKDCSSTSVKLVSLTHDFCKIGLYSSYFRNVKNEETGQWEKALSYKYNSPQIPMGHGVSSMYIAGKFFKMNTEELLAIRWHMGEYHCCKAEESELQDARDRYPLVLLLQTADRLAVTEY